MLIRSCAAGRCCRLAVHGDGGVRRLLLFIRGKDEQKVLENFFSILADLAKKSKGEKRSFHMSEFIGHLPDVLRVLCGNLCDFSDGLRRKGQKKAAPGALKKRPGARCCSVLIGRRRSCRRRDRRRAPRHRCGGSPPPAGSSRRGRRGNTRPRALAGARPAPPVSR